MVSTVGVFVNWPADVVAALGRSLQLSAVQLHGDEPPEQARALAGSFRVIKAFAVKPGFRVATLRKFRAASAFLLDGSRDGLYGGTGRTVDWSVARQASRAGRIILAGGITPDNVAQAIAEARPFAVDVASGVESRPGKKDPAALRALMREVQAANQSAKPAAAQGKALQGKHYKGKD